MSIKSKIRLGFGALFFLALLISGMAIYFLYRLSADSNAILKDNYDSLKFMKGMLAAMDRIPDGPDQTDLATMEKNLKLQERNITEPGEREITEALRIQFEILKKVGNQASPYLKNTIRNLIYRILQVNMNPIEKKNSIAFQTTERATWLVAIIGTLGFLLAFTLFLNFPGYIADPITELTHRIQEISNRNYQQPKLEGRMDEFGSLYGAFNIMTTKLTEFENSNLSRLLFEKKRTETLINSLNEGIIGLNENSGIIFVNQVACSLLGMNQEELLERYAPDIALFNDLLRNLLTQKGSPIKIFSEGRECFFSKEILPVLSGEEIIGKVIILKNITEYKKRDEDKTHFIATISHELKTPLSSIKMSLKLLEDSRVGNLNSEQVHLLNNIGEDTHRLMTMTTELLDMTQVETGKISLHFGSSPPNVIVNYALNALKFIADQKQIQFHTDCDPNLPPVFADLEKTTWVMGNLMSNAIKYSREGSSIDISVKEKEGEIEFSVQDHGQGIDEQYQEKVFDRYFKVPGESQEKNGTGLGLSIARDFIEAQSGKIGMESEIGMGSRFYFLLPRA